MPFNTLIERMKVLLYECNGASHHNKYNAHCYECNYLSLHDYSILYSYGRRINDFSTIDITKSRNVNSSNTFLKELSAYTDFLRKKEKVS